ncbi:MAG: PAS domain S-box protein [bacterium]|nr:PAS domain S-box protein [bacterium]
MERQERLKRLGWFLPLKLASYIILLAIVAFWMGNPGYLQVQLILYSVCTLGFTAAISLEKRFSLKTVTQVLIALQFLLEIWIESGVIYATGNVNSPFSALFLLTIVSAALAYRLVGTLVVASLVSGAYAFIIWLGLSQNVSSDLNMQALRTIFSTQDYVFYSIFLHILIFYLVAFISGYLAERLSHQDRKLADASLALKRARLETDDILKHLNSGLLTIDPFGYIIYFNRAAEKILGYREEEVRGMRCEEVFAERMPRLSQCLMEAVRYGHDLPRMEIDIVTIPRATVPLGLSISILTDEGKGIRGVIAIFTDLTDAKALEQKARAADRLAAVGELSASIAHEIRNPLAAISGSVEVLARDIKPVGENARLMELIVKESHRLSRILTDFLSYARVNRPTYNKVELCHIISDVIELTKHHESFRDSIKLRFESESSIVYAVGDENLIKQVLMNLAINACEAFGASGGQVVFRIFEDHARGTVELRVIDDGPGISDKDKEKIFQPFYSTKTHGTGLGLAIVHRICTALRLHLSVDSREGKGTSFSIVLNRFAAEKGGMNADRERDQLVGV